MAQVGRFTTGSQQLGDQRGVGAVGSLDAVAKSPVTGENGGGDPVDLDASRDRQVGRDRIREDRVGGLQPHDTVTHLRGDQAAFDRGVDVDDDSQSMCDGAVDGHRDGVAKHRDDFCRGPHRRGSPVQGSRDSTGQRHCGIDRDLPSCRVEGLRKRLPQLREQHAQQQRGALGRFGEAGCGATRDRVAEDAAGELLRVVDGERSEVDSGAVGQRCGQAIEEGGRAPCVRTCRCDEEERLVDETTDRETQGAGRGLVDPLGVVDEDGDGGAEPVHGIQEQTPDRNRAVRRLRGAHT